MTAHASMLQHGTMAYAFESGLSQQTLANILLIARNVRPAARVRIPRRNLGVTQDLARKLGLTMLVGFESQAQAGPSYSEWTTFIRDPYNPNSTTFAYFGMDRRLLE